MTRRDQDAEAAIEKYRQFHRYDPKEIGAFPAAFRIPDRVWRAGDAKWVAYRSGKVDPATLRKPRAPVNYIHEHDAGVVCYLAERVDGAAEVDVPQRFRDTGALTRLGYCLGFCFADPEDGEPCEASGKAPLPELYTTPDGKCLIVIQSRRRVLAMMWGGGLGVFPRGIDG